MFRYWVDIDIKGYEIIWTENDMLVPLNMYFEPNNRLTMNYDCAYLITIF